MSEHEPANEPNEQQPQYPTYPLYPDAGSYPPPQPAGPAAPQAESGYADPPRVAGPGYPPAPPSGGYPSAGAYPAMFGPTAPAPAQRAASPRRTILVAAVLAALIGGGIGAGTVAVADNNNSGNSAAGLSFSTQAAPAAKTDGTVEAAAKKIGPSVVTVNVSASQEADTGSGVIIRQDGYILTNNHVIAAAGGGGGATIGVTLADGRQAAAKIVGTDPSDDLAVLKVKLTGLTAATFASSSSLQVGQTVVAVGAPLGLSDTVTSGIVSTISRPVTTSDDQNDQAVFDAVQTDAAINPGNSGGPLVNLNGNVVGINAAIATDQSSGGLQLPGQQSQSGNIGIGFAIPSDEAARIAGQLISTGKATHAVMGVEVAASQSSGVTASGGATITKVTAGSAAAKAGLQAGDVVTSLAGQRIAAADALIAAVRSHAPGQKVSVTYTRAGSSKTATLTLGTGSD